MKIIHDMYEYAEKISMRLGKEDVELTTDEDVIAFIVSNEKEYIRILEELKDDTVETDLVEKLRMFEGQKGLSISVSLENNALVVKDSEGQTVASSNAVLEEITVEEDTDEPTTPEEPVQPGEENPSTSDNFMIFAGLAVIALGLGTVTFRKLCK